MNKTYGNASAAEIAKYHIDPDVIARWPDIAEWAESHDLIDDFKDAVDGLVNDAACNDVLDGIEMFMNGRPDETPLIAEAREYTSALRSQFATLAGFRDMCVDALEGDNDEDRILDAIRLGEKLRRLRTLEHGTPEAIELAAELGVSI